MLQTIPASQIVSVIPGVISAGGTALDMNGLGLSTAARVPIGSVLSFPTKDAVASYFGASSTEAALAAVYFAGFDNSHVKPGAMLWAQYPQSAVGGWLRGGPIASLADVQALGASTLSLTVAGVVKTSASINLSGATSLSNAATLIQAAFTSPGFTVTYDSVSGGFLFANTATGASSTLTFASGTIATGLKLTASAGATLSQGADAATPAAFMDGVVRQTTNWVSFFTAFNPDGSGNAVKQALASWVNAQANRFIYVAWDTDTTPTASTAATGSLGYLLKAANSSGTVVLFAPDATKAAMVSGWFASLDFTQTNGRATFAFRAQTGQSADVTDATIAANLLANGYSFYGAYGTANDGFTFLYDGSITGPFKWADSYINQVWMNNGLQLALMTLLTSVYSVPYNADGYALIEAACLDPINAAVNFGAIRAGVPLSALQAAEVNSAAGREIDRVLSTRGWLLQILPATAIVRAARASPPMSLWYVDGQSVQRINLASIEVQ